MGADYSDLSLSHNELLIIQKGNESIRSLVESIAISRDESSRVSLQDERIVVNNIKQMYRTCIQRKQRVLQTLREEITALKKDWFREIENLTELENRAKKNTSKLWIKNQVFCFRKFRPKVDKMCKYDGRLTISAKFWKYYTNKFVVQLSALPAKRSL